MAAREKKPWPLCSALLADSTQCRSAVVRDADGELSEFCAHHLKIQASPAPPVAGEDLLLAAAAKEPEPEPPRESERIASIRAALRDDLLSAETAEAVRDLLMEGLTAHKTVFSTCKGCGKRSPVELPDLSGRVAAASSLLDQIEGKLAQQAKSSEDRVSEALASKTRLEDLTNDELTLLMLEQNGPDWDLRTDVHEIARRVLAEETA